MIALIIILSLVAFVIAFALSFPLWAIFWGVRYRHKRRKRLAREAEALTLQQAEPQRGRATVDYEWLC